MYMYHRVNVDTVCEKNGAKFCYKKHMFKKRLHIVTKLLSILIVKTSIARPKIRVSCKHCIVPVIEMKVVSPPPPQIKKNHFLKFDLTDLLLFVRTTRITVGYVRTIYRVIRTLV
jgi:hypothetical protein